MIDFLKSNFNLSTLFSLWAIFCFISYRFQKKRLLHWSVVTGLLLFLICSTSFIPRILIEKLESTYSALDIKKIDTAQNYYIHVLGAGYDPDPTLPATAQLDLKTLGRLIEGIRVFKQLPNSILVTSGYAGKNLGSQASVARRAAIALGVPKDRIHILETPSTTWEEVLAFQQTFGDKGIPIIATYAAHMPRAMKMFRAAGYEPIAAPTNFKIKCTGNKHGFTLPNVHSIRLMDTWLHEVLGEWKWEIRDKR